MAGHPSARGQSSASVASSEARALADVSRHGGFLHAPRDRTGVPEDLWSPSSLFARNIPSGCGVE